VKIVLNVTKKAFHLPKILPKSTCTNESKQLLNFCNTPFLRQILTAVMTHIVVYKSTDHAKPHSIWFLYHNTKHNEGKLCQDLLTIENIDSDFKVHTMHYANELLVRVRLSFHKLLQTRLTCRNNPCIRLAREKFELTNQDSVGGSILVSCRM